MRKYKIKVTRIRADKVIDSRYMLFIYDEREKIK